MGLRTTCVARSSFPFRFRCRFELRCGGFRTRSPDLRGGLAWLAEDALCGLGPDVAAVPGLQNRELAIVSLPPHEAERQLPRVPAMVAPLLRRPFLWIVLLVVLPQLAASIVNIGYNSFEIVSQLSGAQKSAFKHLVIGYNVIVYPAAILAFVLIVWPVWRCWNALSRGERLANADVETARLRALRLPRWIAALTAIGWFPGGIIFPAVLKATTGLDNSLAAHFVASFWLSGLIALAYSLCGVEFVVLRGVYPGLWRDAQNYTAVARDELAPVNRHLNLIEVLAGSIPLVAASLTIMLGHGTTATFRGLAVALIILGGFGFHVTSAITRHLSQVIVALTHTKA